MNITFTIDLEDPTERYAPDGRYVAMTHRILDLCDEIGRKATFFTVGRVAEQAPELVSSIAAKGHEVAYHSHNHVSLTKENPERFRSQTYQDKDRLQQLTGQEIVGFRAPRFSLTPQSLWALDTLHDLEFRYSSSVMPTDVSLFGFPEASTKPFAWPNGIIEFPLPVATIGKYRVPYLGGIYLYTLPSLVTKQFLAKADKAEVLWTYTHPYDFDREEGFSRMPNTPYWVSLVLWQARRNAEKKIRDVLKMGSAGTLASKLSTFEKLS